MNKQKIYGTILAIMAPIAYGTYPIFVNFTLNSNVNTSTLLVVRFWGCSLLMWIYCIICKKKFHFKVKTGFGLIAIGIFFYAGMAGMNLLSLTMLSASLASLIISAYPLFVTLFSVILGRIRFSILLFVSLVTCILGLWLVMDVHSGNLNILGILLALGASIAYALYILLGSMIGEKIDPVVRATLIMTGVCVSYSVILTPKLSFAFKPSGWFWIISIILFITVIPTLLFWIAVDKIGDISASVFGIIEPISTVILSVILLGEKMSTFQALGIFIVIVSIFVIQMLQLKKHNKSS